MWENLLDGLINSKQSKPFLPSESISFCSIKFGMLNCIANNAAAAGQKATRGIFIFAATSKAHPRFSSAITPVILLPPNPLIVFISSSSFTGMTCNIVSVNLPRLFLSSQGFRPSGSDTR
ncbi:hypothetical protein IC582_020665 [Cucumis melo]